jgi:hypothetical protein
MMNTFVLAAIASIGCTNALKLESTTSASTEQLDIKAGAKCMADHGIMNLVGMSHGDLAVVGSNCIIDH